MSRPTLGVSLGDPAGIGPEIVLKLIQRPSIRRRYRIVLFGHARVLDFYWRRLFHGRRPAWIVPVRSPLGVTSSGSIVPIVEPPSVSARTVSPGVVNRWSGEASGAYVGSAVAAAMRGEIDALVTAPLHKESFSLSRWGRRFVGHTEMVARLSGAKRARLMLMRGRLRAVHVTSHIPLKDVAAAVTKRNVEETLAVAVEGLRDLGIQRPKIAVCGLNPHAGDGGVLGNEDAKAILPAVRSARRRGIEADGPLPADVVWPRVLSGEFDAGVAMYHDQGQIPVKMMAFRTARRSTVVTGVNVTLGLSVVRTSVAHGTAHDIAGRGVASEASLEEACEVAAQIILNRRQRRRRGR